METVQYFRDRAAQCRRLADGINDDRAIRELRAMAEKYEVQARDAGAREQAEGRARRH